MKYIKKFEGFYDDDDFIEDTGSEWHKSDNENIEKAISEIKAMGIEDRMFQRNHYFIDNDVVIEVVNFDGHVWLKSIMTLSDARGKGLASKVLDKICDICDKYEVYSMVSPKAFGNGGPKTQKLKDWYIKFGFTNIVHGNMERAPEKKEWKENLQKLHTHLMGEINNKISLNKQYNFIDANKLDILNLIKTYIITPKFRAGVLTKYKVEIPKVLHLVKKIVADTEYHKHMKWQISDSMFEKETHFVFVIHIEIPKEEKYRQGNVMYSISLYIKPNNRRKEFSELYNTPLNTDQESNLLKFTAMVKNFGDAMEKEFEIPVKVGKLRF